MRGPYGKASVVVVGIISGGGNGEGQFVFVIIFLVVATDADKNVEVVVVEDFARLLLGVDKHLHLFVLTEVEDGGFVSGNSLTIRQIGNVQSHRLFVLLHDLIGHIIALALNAGGQDVIDGSLAAVFFEADVCNVEDALIVLHVGNKFARRGHCSGIFAPIAAHEVHLGKTQDNVFFGVGQVHTEEPDALEVGDCADHAIRLIHRHFKLIPFHSFGLAIDGLDARFHDVGDVILTYLHTARRDMHFVLVIRFCFGKSVVQVNILHIRITVFNR